MADDRHAPRPAQQSLPRQAAHVGDISIVDREAKHPGEKRQRAGVSAGLWDSAESSILYNQFKTRATRYSVDLKKTQSQPRDLSHSRNKVSICEKKTPAGGQAPPEI